MDNINLYFIGLWNSFKYYMNCCGDSLYDPEFTHDLNPYYYNGQASESSECRSCQPLRGESGQYART